MHSGVHPSLCSNCYHQIVFAKFNLTHFYSFSYKRLVGHYQKANAEQENRIKKGKDLFGCEKTVSTLDVNKQVSNFSKTIMNTFDNVFPHETIIFNDKDSPWMNRQFKSFIAKKKTFFFLTEKLQTLIYLINLKL